MSSLTKATSSKFSGRMPAMYGAAGVVGDPGAQLLGQVSSTIGSVTVSPSTSAGKKFIAGEPMKPATNRLAGSV